jgi:hypothetical protein
MSARWPRVLNTNPFSARLRKPHSQAEQSENGIVYLKTELKSPDLQTNLPDRPT